MERKKECNIVQDLLLGYVDEILTEDSKEFVEKHIKECKECEGKFNEIERDIEQNDKYNEGKEVEYLKNVKKKISRKNKYMIVISIILVAVIIFNIAVLVNYNIEKFKMDIYLNEDLTEEQLENIKQTIKSKDSQAEIIYYSKQEELDKMKEKLGEKKYLLDNYEENNVFPAHFEVKIKQKNIMKELEQDLIIIPNVKTIHSNVSNNPYMLFFDKILE